ncbi:hypothetical protein BHM03_00040000 [Ensete ventricosum]|nr:hypothetical protein BHM03_00040000 [Ensete ventricosum]
MKPAAAGSSHRLLEIQMAQRRLPFFFLLIVALAVFSTLLGGAPMRADLALLMVKCREYVVPRSKKPTSCASARTSRRRCRSLYSGCCRSSVLGNLAAIVAYHAVVHLHHTRVLAVRHASTSKGVGLTCVRSTVRPLGIQPYLCQVGRTDDLSQSISERSDPQ